MHRILQVGLSDEAFRQIDDLRSVYPDLGSRKDVLLQLLAEAHAKIGNAASTTRL